jgi:hypothetical protein
VKRRTVAVLATALSLAALMSACTDGPATSGVPTLTGSANAGSGGNAGGGPNPNAANGDGSAERRARLRAAAQCVREHGAPNYQDPVLTADGRVYTDEVALRELDEQEAEAVETACAEQIRAANFDIADQAPPPPAVIQAGVRSAECLRAHGLPNVKDPTANSRFTPGKGFGLNPDDLPAGGKEDPTVRRALGECRSVLNEEARLSSLGNLTNA